MSKCTKNCYVKTNRKFRHPATTVLVLTVKSGVLQETYKSVINMALTVMKHGEAHLNQYW